MAAEADRRQRAVGEAIFVESAVWRPVLEAPRLITDRLAPDAATAKPAEYEIAVSIGFRLFGTRIREKHKIDPPTLGHHFEQHCR